MDYLLGRWPITQSHPTPYTHYLSPHSHSHFLEVTLKDHSGTKYSDLPVAGAPALAPVLRPALCLSCLSSDFLPSLLPMLTTDVFCGAKGLCT